MNVIKCGVHSYIQIRHKYMFVVSNTTTPSYLFPLFIQEVSFSVFVGTNWPEIHYFELGLLDCAITVENWHSLGFHPFHRQSCVQKLPAELMKMNLMRPFLKFEPKMLE